MPGKKSKPAGKSALAQSVEEAQARRDALFDRHRLERQQADTELRLAQERALAAIERSLSAKNKKPSTHLVIPDSHARPGYRNDRYTWLGRMIGDLQPDVVVNLGDHADMESLCWIDQSSRGSDMRSYGADIEVVHDSLLRLNAGIKETAPKDWMPRGKVLCHGNHENRIRKVANTRVPGSDGISIEDLGYREMGWTEVPYYQGVQPGEVVIDGVVYCHYLAKPTRPNTAVGSSNVYPCRSVYQADRGGGVSRVYGHTHREGKYTVTNGYGQKVTVLNAGLYSEEHFHYAGADNDRWWRGLVVLHNVIGGDFEPEWWPISKVRKTYGD